MHYIYILRSLKDKSIYVGYTENLKQRLTEHNSKKAVYTSAHSPYNLQWYCAFLDKKKALDFEKYLKHGSGHAFAKKRLE